MSELAAARHPRSDFAEPLIIGIGGTLRDGSTSERALQVSLEAARRAGARTHAFTGRDLMLPIYELGAEPTPEATAFVEMLRICDGLIVSSPSYHGGVSGLIKNAIDYVEDLRDDQRVYLDGRAVGTIVCAAGVQSIGTTLSGLRSMVHALRGWPSPLGAGINTTEIVDGEFPAGTIWQLEEVGRQVAGFAMMQRAAEQDCYRRMKAAE